MWSTKKDLKIKQWKTYILKPYSEIKGTYKEPHNPGITKYMIPKFGKEIKLMQDPDNHRWYISRNPKYYWHKDWVEKHEEIESFDNLLESIKCL